MNQISAAASSSAPNAILTLAAAQSSPATAWAGAESFHATQNPVITNPGEDVSGLSNRSYEPTLLEDTLANLNSQIADMRSRMAGTASAVAALTAIQSHSAGLPSGSTPFPGIQTLQPTQPNMGVSLTDTLHSAPQYLVDMAASGAYMDLVLFLPQNLPRLPAVKPSEQDFEKLKGSLTQISSYESWLEAFITYTSLLVISRPDKVSQLFIRAGVLPLIRITLVEGYFLNCLLFFISPLGLDNRLKCSILVP